MRVSIAALVVFATIATQTPGAVTSTVVDIPVASGTQRFLYVRPEAPGAGW